MRCLVSSRMLLHFNNSRESHDNVQTYNYKTMETHLRPIHTVRQRLRQNSFSCERYHWYPWNPLWAEDAVGSRTMWTRSLRLVKSITWVNCRCSRCRTVWTSLYSLMQLQAILMEESKGSSDTLSTISLLFFKPCKFSEDNLGLWNTYRTEFLSLFKLQSYLIYCAQPIRTPEWFASIADKENCIRRGTEPTRGSMLLIKAAMS